VQEAPMNRRQALSVVALFAMSAWARPASAEGIVRFHNVSFPGGVVVEVRVGESIDSATLYGTRKIVKDDVWEVDTGGGIAWWRRELSPGSNDGRYTAWQSSDPAEADQRVEL
jgi:hypothetical protein